MGEIRNSFNVQCRNANIAKERLKNTMLKEIKKDMRKLLNKLFEWLGYVPKVEFTKIKEEYMMLKKYRYLKSSILANEVRYKIGEMSKYFVVYMTNRDVNYPIKVFYFIDNDKEYAKLCAEELCEKLNERI